jgi:hypothetical protein
MKLIKSKWNRVFVHPEDAPGGLYVGIKWLRDVQEWFVWPSWSALGDYYTDDSADAIATAHHMVALKLNQEHAETAPADCLCNVCIPH